MMSELAKKHCKPCEGKSDALESARIKELHQELNSGWELMEDHHIEKEFRFDGYQPAVDFTNKVANLAKEENHHPDILLSYGKVKVTLWTHKAGGLTENDFVLAAKIEERRQK
ncbi:MAG: 4a-hydroxytetrahydrobiopterin dehydratase [Candidatus Hydrogenedentota bacterium]